MWTLERKRSSRHSAMRTLVRPVSIANGVLLPALLQSFSARVKMG
jgi:hypothetical protein